MLWRTSLLTPSYALPRALSLLMQGIVLHDAYTRLLLDVLHGSQVTGSLPPSARAQWYSARVAVHSSTLRPPLRCAALRCAALPRSSLSTQAMFVRQDELEAGTRPSVAVCLSAEYPAYSTYLGWRRLWRSR